MSSLLTTCDDRVDKRIIDKHKIIFMLFTRIANGRQHYMAKLERNKFA